MAIRYVVALALTAAGIADFVIGFLVLAPRASDERKPVIWAAMALSGCLLFAIAGAAAVGYLPIG